MPEGCAVTPYDSCICNCIQKVIVVMQTIRLNGTAKMVRRTKYPKSGKMVETQRADSREGALRSQLNISPEGHCHMRCELPLCSLERHQESLFSVRIVLRAVEEEPQLDSSPRPLSHEVRSPHSMQLCSPERHFLSHLDSRFQGTHVKVAALRPQLSISC